MSTKNSGGRPKEDISKNWIKKIKKTSTCWLWVASTDPKGYGIFWDGYQQIKAHRYSYTIYKGLIPIGIYVCHLCDNPSCVNPDHLWLGSAKDNIQDCIKKGRKNMPKGDNHWTRRLKSSPNQRHKENKPFSGGERQILRNP